MDGNTPESGDPLEAELSGLRPAALTRQAVARIRLELAGDEDVRRTHDLARTARRWFIGALAAGMAAAVVVTAWVRHDLIRTKPIVSTQPNWYSGPGAPTVLASSAPDHPVTLAAYRAALARSPEEALALMDRPARSAGAPAESSPRAFGPLTLGVRGDADAH
jgi:hypothetical protein